MHIMAANEFSDLIQEKSDSDSESDYNMEELQGQNATLNREINRLNYELGNHQGQLLGKDEVIEELRQRIAALEEQHVRDQEQHVRDQEQLRIQEQHAHRPGFIATFFGNN